MLTSSIRTEQSNVSQRRFNSTKQSDVEARSQRRLGYVAGRDGGAGAVLRVALRHGQTAGAVRAAERKIRGDSIGAVAD